MKVSHRCPNCDTYNKVGDGFIKTDGEMTFTCVECGASWHRQKCDTCGGTGFFLNMPCDCDGGMEWAPKIDFTPGGKKAIQSKPTFGQKSDPEKDFSL